MNKKISKRNVNTQMEESLTYGQKIADRLTAFGGSWKFIVLFFIIILLWMTCNTTAYLYKGPAFDPYPFILLNLVLSCLAAIQAPIIMMGQNYQAKKDRIAAENDYIVNLKSELLLLELTYKVNKLLNVDHEDEHLKNSILEIVQTLDALQKNDDTSTVV